MRRALTTTPSLLLVALLVTACERTGAPEPRAAGAIASAPGTLRPGGAAPLREPTNAPAARDDGRLPRLAVPLRYSLELTVDPGKPRFAGKATILVDVPKPTAQIVLHARDLHLTKSVAKIGGAELAAIATSRVAHGSTTPEELVLSFPRELPAGQAVLELEYDAPFADDLHALHRIKDGDRWYAFSHFEPVGARRAFPSFDEPSWKTPFDLTVTVPRGMIAVANSPESQRLDHDASTTFTFATSRPMPTYLVALAVGDFDVRAGATSPVPIRLITTKGKAALGALALDATAALVARLGAYFDVRYPYEKLDIVAIPDFASGAMENPGLITFRESLLLLDPQRASSSSRRVSTHVIAHELAHMWFGDLVTMEWWDDLWLNEGFANWMGTHVVDAREPAFGGRLEDIADISEVMDVDALGSARAVRQPVRSTGEALEAFDGLTYRKGAAILRMTEGWIGGDALQRGVRDYVRAHAWKNARSSDLLRALDLASNSDVSKMARSFLDRAGVPRLRATLTTAGNRATLHLHQSPWRPLGAAAPEGPPRYWTMPVCARVDGQPKPVCTTLDGESGSVTFAAAAPPKWFYPNASGAGYLRVSLEESDIRALVKNLGRLDDAERIGFLSNVWAMVRAGDISPSVLLETLPAFDGERSHHVVAQLIEILRAIDSALIEEAARPAWRRYVAARLAPRAQKLGWGRAGEAEEQTLMRRVVLPALGDLAEDEATLREAERHARAWLKDTKSVSGDVAQIAVVLASRRAGEARLTELSAALERASVPQDRIIALRALSAIGDPRVLRKALDLVVTDAVRMSDLRYFPWPVLGYRASRPVFYEWLKASFDAVRAKVPGKQRGALANVATTMCTPAERDDARAFLTPRLANVDGAKRPLEGALEAASSCISLRERASAVTVYLRRP